MKKLRKYTALTAGSLILAFGVYNIHARCQVTEGGVLGLSLLISRWTGLSPGIICLLLDIAAFTLAITVLGFGFLRDSILCTIAYTGWYSLMEVMGPLLPDLSPWPAAAAVAGALFVGLGCGLIVRHDCAASGDDALALFCHRITGLRVSVFYFISDCTVLALSLSYIPLKRIIWSLVTVTLSSLIIEALRPRTEQSASGARR